MKPQKLKLVALGGRYVFILFLLLVIMLISCFAYIMNGTYEVVYQNARRIALDYTVLNSGAMNQMVSGADKTLSTLAGRLAAAADRDTFLDDLARADGTTFAYVRYTRGSTVYESSGFPLTSSEDEELTALRKSGKAGSTGVIFDTRENLRGVALYVPVSGSEYMDGLIGFISTAVNEQLATTAEEAQAKPLYSAMASTSGRILYAHTAKDFYTDKSTNVFDYIRNLTTDKTVLDDVQKAIRDNKNGSKIITVSTQKCVLTYCPVSSTSMVAYSVYDPRDLAVSGYVLIDRLTVTIVCLCVLFLGMLGYLIIFQRKYHRRAKEGVVVDPLLGCSTFSKFCTDANELMKSNPNSTFAVLYMEVYKFQSITSGLGADVGDGIIRFINKVLNNCLTSNEKYGHMNDDKFVMIWHYSSVRELMDRVKIINALLMRYNDDRIRSHSLKLSSGAYCAERNEKISAEEMVDRASIAQKTSDSQALELCTIYDDSVRTKFMREAEIEARMAQALEDGQFEAFYQPKYSFYRDRVEGAEALVRWYDQEAGQYIMPDTFIPLFESDGFISRLDRYMFVEVCKTIAATVENGGRIVPISVNVSRVTALQPDFTTYYMAEKKRYHIADGFIILEFTESFASENYDTMRQIVSRLKNAGFLCSIDDFGSGYSSYNILKELPMDELKLDKFFIKKGIDAGKDDILLSMMISLAKKFNMKVTQEGVDSDEEMERLRRFGCDVVQGFYYARPIPQKDFLDFISDDTSLLAVRDRQRIS